VVGLATSLITPFYFQETWPHTKHLNDASYVSLRMQIEDTMFFNSIVLAFSLSNGHKAGRRIPCGLVVIRQRVSLQ
jgi:hypothetical protein